jgi:hypothetical protein
MIGGAAAASTLALAFLALLAVPLTRDSEWLYPTGHLLSALTQAGIRVARKTCIVDKAEGDRRTEYVAVANTARWACC